MRPGFLAPASRIIAIITPGVRALNVGGNYGNGTNAGPFYLNGNNAPANTNANLGSRLLIQDIVSPRSLFRTAR